MLVFGCMSAKGAQYCLDEGTQCRKMTSIFQGQSKSGESLDKFLKSTVEPTAAQSKAKGQEIDKFVSNIQQRFSTQRPYTVSQVFKSGSVGKGTDVRGSPDIELVVFFNGMPTADDLQRETPALLEILAKEVSSPQFQTGKNSIIFTLDGAKVTLRLASDTLRQQLKPKPDAIYTAMSRYSGGVEQATQLYSSSLVPLQVEFVKKAPGNVKGVMRLLKYLAQENQLDIDPFSLELLAVYVSRQFPKFTDTDNLMRECLRMLATPSSLAIAFADYYDTHAYTRNLNAPYILNPANPYHNNLAGVNTDKVAAVAQRICTSCSSTVPPKGDL